MEFDNGNNNNKINYVVNRKHTTGELDIVINKKEEERECHICTLLNDPKVNKCIVCETPRKKENKKKIFINNNNNILTWIDCIKLLKYDIRFPLINKNYFEKNIADHNILTVEETFLLFRYWQNSKNIKNVNNVKKLWNIKSRIPESLIMKLTPLYESRLGLEILECKANSNVTFWRMS